MSKTYHCDIEVRGYELDSFGHVNHAVYFNYLEHARWKMLNEEGITLEWISREQLWPVIAAVEVKYLKPTFMGDQLVVKTRVIDNRAARFILEQDIFRGDIQVLAGKVTSVVVNAQGRPVEIPEPYRKLWS